MRAYQAVEARNIGRDAARASHLLHRRGRLCWTARRGVRGEDAVVALARDDLAVAHGAVDERVRHLRLHDAPQPARRLTRPPGRLQRGDDETVALEARSRSGLAAHAPKERGALFRHRRLREGAQDGRVGGLWIARVGKSVEEHAGALQGLELRLRVLWCGWACRRKRGRVGG